MHAYSYLSRTGFIFFASLLFLVSGCFKDAGPESARALTDAAAIADSIAEADSLAMANVVADSITQIAAIETADVYYAQCGNEIISMADILLPLTASMEARQIPYTRSQSPVDEWRDCSGNFLRLSSHVAAQCAGNDDFLAAPAGINPYSQEGDNEAPENKGARSSRGIGKWYHEQGRFTPIYYDDVSGIAEPPQDLIDLRNLIKPGAVLWFSRQKPVSNDGLGNLWANNPANTQINHMGTVTEVTRDDEGNVIGYKMYHGHGDTGNPASVTEHHYWEWPATFTNNGSSYPPLGYWGQYLVGIGTLLPTQAPPAEV